MMINTTPKEMPTRYGNPTAGNAINDSNSHTREQLGKALETLRALFTLCVHILNDVALFLTKIEGQI